MAIDVGGVRDGTGEATDTVLSDWLEGPVRLVEAGMNGDRADGWCGRVAHLVGAPESPDGSTHDQFGDPSDPD